MLIFGRFWKMSHSEDIGEFEDTILHMELTLFNDYLSICLEYSFPAQGSQGMDIKQNQLDIKQPQVKNYDCILEL